MQHFVPLTLTERSCGAGACLPTDFVPLTLTEQVAKVCRWYSTVDSTNSEARRSAPELATQLEYGDVAVLAAEQQTAGRGRLERTWHTIPGKSLAASFVTRLPHELVFSQHGFWLTTLAGVALLEAAIDTVSALSDYFSSVGYTFSLKHSPSLNYSQLPTHYDNDYHFQLKWPNDLICRGKKIAGILTESIAGPESLVIFGIGFNLTVPQEQLPTDFATSLHLHYALPQVLTSTSPRTYTTTSTCTPIKTPTNTPTSRASLSMDEPLSPGKSHASKKSEKSPSSESTNDPKSSKTSLYLSDLLASKIVTRLSAHLREFQANPEKHCVYLHEIATKCSYTLGKPVSASLPNGEKLQGLATRLLPNASLEICTPSGLREISVGDVNACCQNTE